MGWSGRVGERGRRCGMRRMRAAFDEASPVEVASGRNEERAGAQAGMEEEGGEGRAGKDGREINNGEEQNQYQAILAVGKCSRGLTERSTRGFSVLISVTIPVRLGVCALVAR